MEEPIRVRLPRNKEILGQIEELLGGSRFRVACQDGKTRMCRVPGRFRRRLRVRVGDWLIIKPWDVQGDEKADVVWIYNRTQTSWLMKNNYIK